MERNEAIYQAVLAEAKAAGIKDTKLDMAFKGSDFKLPEMGKFVNHSIEEYDGNKFLVLNSVDSTGKPNGKVALGNICATAHNGKREDAQFTQQTSDDTKDSYNGWFLSGKAVNPELSQDQAETVAMLTGKSFMAKRVEQFTLPVKRDKATKKYIFHTLEDSARKELRTKRFYQISAM